MHYPATKGKRSSVKSSIPPKEVDLELFNLFESYGYQQPDFEHDVLKQYDDEMQNPSKSNMDRSKSEYIDPLEQIKFHSNMSREQITYVIEQLLKRLYRFMFKAMYQEHPHKQHDLHPDQEKRNKHHEKVKGERSDTGTEKPKENVEAKVVNYAEGDIARHASSHKESPEKKEKKTKKDKDQKESKSAIVQPEKIQVPVFVERAKGGNEYISSKLRQSNKRGKTCTCCNYCNCEYSRPNVDSNGKRVVCNCCEYCWCETGKGFRRGVEKRLGSETRPEFDTAENETLDEEDRLNRGRSKRTEEDEDELREKKRYKSKVKKTYQSKEKRSDRKRSDPKRSDSKRERKHRRSKEDSECDPKKRSGKGRYEEKRTIEQYARRGKTDSERKDKKRTHSSDKELLKRQCLETKQTFPTEYYVDERRFQDNSKKGRGSKSNELRKSPASPTDMEQPKHKTRGTSKRGPESEDWGDSPRGSLDDEELRRGSPRSDEEETRRGFEYEESDVSPRRSIDEEDLRRGSPRSDEEETRRGFEYEESDVSPRRSIDEEDLRRDSPRSDEEETRKGSEYEESDVSPRRSIDDEKLRRGSPRSYEEETRRGSEYEESDVSPRRSIDDEKPRRGSPRSYEEETRRGSEDEESDVSPRRSIDDEKPPRGSPPVPTQPRRGEGKTKRESESEVSDVSPRRSIDDDKRRRVSPPVPTQPRRGEGKTKRESESEVSDVSPRRSIDDDKRRRVSPPVPTQPRRREGKIGSGSEPKDSDDSPRRSTDSPRRSTDSPRRSTDSPRRSTDDKKPRRPSPTVPFQPRTFEGYDEPDPRQPRKDDRKRDKRDGDESKKNLTIKEAIEEVLKKGCNCGYAVHENPALSTSYLDICKQYAGCAVEGCLPDFDLACKQICNEYLKGTRQWAYFFPSQTECNLKS